jgi:hypothetical protein
VAYQLDSSFEILDIDRKVFRNFEPKSYIYRDTELDFHDLPLDLVGTGLKGWSLDVSTPRQKGKEIEFTARHIGVFQITATWLIREPGEKKSYIHSIPVILIVQPSSNEKGQPIIKPDWILKL